MKPVIFLTVFAFFVFPFALTGASQSDDLVGDFVRVDTGHPPPEKPFTVLLGIGDIVQLSVRCRIFEKEMLSNLKIQIKGDSVEKIGVALVPVPGPGPKGLVDLRNTDNTTKDFSCFLKAVKKGNAVVTITPLGKDGKQRPTRELLIKVGVKKRDY